MDNVEIRAPMGIGAAYSTNLLRRLYSDRINSDVTVDCQGQRIKTHKGILAACSPVIAAIFKGNNNVTTLVFLEVNPRDFKNIMDYMYFGEVIIPKSQITGFLRTGQLLKISGFEPYTNLSDTGRSTQPTTATTPMMSLLPNQQPNPKSLPGTTSTM